MNNNESYNGNPRVKRDGIDQQYDSHQLEEYIQCSEDPTYFINNYVKVISLDEGLTLFKLRGYQTKMINHLNTNRYSCILSGRQSGKCFHTNTIVTIRDKATNKIEKITIGELYERQAKRNLQDNPR